MRTPGAGSAPPSTATASTMCCQAKSRVRSTWRHSRSINSKRVSLLDDKRLFAQFTGLERRSGRSGRDTVDHGPSGHDDICNAAAGALLLCRVGLGRTALPSSFTHCAKGFTDQCYLLGSGGFYMPVGNDPVCCGEGTADSPGCPGHHGALTLYRTYRASGGIDDLRSWAHANVTPPASMQWAQLRAYAKSISHLLK